MTQLTTDWQFKRCVSTHRGCNRRRFALPTHLQRRLKRFGFLCCLWHDVRQEAEFRVLQVRLNEEPAATMRSSGAQPQGNSGRTASYYCCEHRNRVNYHEVLLHGPDHHSKLRTDRRRRFLSYSGLPLQRPSEASVCMAGAHLRISSVTLGFFTEAKRSAYASVLDSIGCTCARHANAADVSHSRRAHHRLCSHRALACRVTGSRWASMSEGRQGMIVLGQLPRLIVGVILPLALDIALEQRIDFRDGQHLRRLDALESCAAEAMEPP